MRKIYALMVLLFAVLQLPAQVLVQGRPHPTAKPQMVSPRAIADGTFTMDMIENWSGEGANRAAFVVQWNAESETSALVWGFRWDGEATGETMARAIAASDPRFFIMTETGTAYGSTVSGFGYDVNKSGDFSITKDGVTLSPDENGIIFSSSYGYDGWTCTDPEDYWQSGWYQGYWSYWLKSSDSDPWGYSGTGITGRKLTDGCWDGWNFSVNMSSQPWKPLAPAPKNGPTAPSVKVQPEDLTVSPGESVTFAPEFKGDSLYFQWYKDEVAIQDAEASSYSIVSAETSDAGRYYCVVSNMLDTISTDTVTLVVGDKSVIAAPGEEPGTALVVYDDSYASFSGILTIPQTILIEGESYTVVGIDDMAFMGCAKLTSVTFPSTLKTIGEGVFYGCSRLTSVELPAQTVSIGNEAFGDCPLLATLSLGEGLKSIGRSAFENCIALTGVSMPADMESIGALAFKGCTKLASAALGNSLTLLGDSAFYGCSSLTEAVLGTGITTLGSSLFRNDAKLKKVVANGKIASVSTYTFNGCSSLERIYINNTPPTGASSNTFTKVPTTCRIYVPAQTCQFYAQTTYWKDFVIMPWLDELEIVSTTPSMSFDGEEALDVKPDTKTFVIEFNRTVVNTDSVSAMLIRSGFPVEDQELTVSYSGNEVTVIREGEDLPNDPYYYLVLTTSDKQFSILFKVTTATGIDDLAVEKEVRLREYYSVDGKLLPCSVEGINIVKTVYEDGSIEVSKVYVKPEDCRR